MIHVEALKYKYPNSKEETLKGLDFSIEKGMIFGFLGPSGSGKSTTQKILYKLLDNFSGQITFDQKPLNEWGREIYEQIGVSFELPNLYTKLTAKENLKFFATFYKNKGIPPQELLAMVGLEKEADKFVADFSKGMKMRLNFARAIGHNPKMLFLDEPTAGLDPVNANNIKSIIKNLQAAGKTIFITTHNMFDADQLCDKVALLHKGKIVSLDTPSNLKLKFGTRTVRLEMKDDPQQYSFELDNLGTNASFLEAIKKGKISTLHSQEATLEEVFIQKTGDKLI